MFNILFELLSIMNSHKNIVFFFTYYSEYTRYKDIMINLRQIIYPSKLG